MTGLEPRPERTAAFRLPSGLPGHSVLQIENGTTYHLMLFFKGPETFYVQINPVRRGLIALTDGAYTMAVMGNSEELRPYRATHTYTQELVPSTFTIKTEGRGSDRWNIGNAGASGPYSVLRVAPDLDRKKIEELWGKRAESTPEETRQEWLAAATGSSSTAAEALRQLARLRTDRDAFQAVERALLTSPDQTLRYIAAEQLLRFRRYFDVRQSFARAKQAGGKDLATFIAGQERYLQPRAAGSGSR
jgi:hypothetical protein